MPVQELMPVRPASDGASIASAALIAHLEGMLTEQDQALLRSYPEGAIDTALQTKDFDVPIAVAVTTGGAARMVATALGATDDTKKTVQIFTTLGLLLLLKSVVDRQPVSASTRARPLARKRARRLRTRPR